MNDINKKKEVKNENDKKEVNLNRLINRKEKAEAIVNETKTLINDIIYRKPNIITDEVKKLYFKGSTASIPNEYIDQVDEKSFIVRFDVWGSARKNAYLACLRVSTQLQAKGFSISNQYDKIKKYIEDNDKVLAMMSIDLGVSGGREDSRKGLLILRNNLLNGDTLISTTQSRILRNAHDFIHLMENLIKRDIGIYIIDKNFDSKNVKQFKMMKTRAFFDSTMRDKASARTTLVLTKESENDILKTRPKYGYRVVEKELVEVPEEQEGILKMIKIREENPTLSWNKLAELINKAGVPTKKIGGKWYHDTVKLILERVIKDKKYQNDEQLSSSEDEDSEEN